MRLILSGATLVLPPEKGLVRGHVVIEEGTIREISTDALPPREVGEGRVIDCGGDFLAPGLVDIHLHGASGRDAMEATSEAFEEILAHHASRGTTTAMLTTVAASSERMLAVLRAVRKYHGEAGGAHLAGIHLEGPWFSPRRRGAHIAECLRFPEETEIESLLSYRDVIRRVTLAPELPGAGLAIRRFRGAGIAVSAGHSDATEEEALAGFAKGITQATHLFNAMSSGRKPGWEGRRGVAEGALATPGIVCELIADGIHVPEELLREAVESKGWADLALVSDATAGAGLPEGSRFRLGDLECVVEGKAAWTGEEGSRCLAGSTSPLFQGVRTMVESCGVSIEEAVAMATLVPARSLGREGEIGSLEVAKRADLVRFSPDWSIKGVWIGGREIGDE
jgi:N-acetylglucosamine-6-phosphate deacetylase